MRRPITERLACRVRRIAAQSILLRSDVLVRSPGRRTPTDPRSPGVTQSRPVSTPGWWRLSVPPELGRSESHLTSHRPGYLLADGLGSASAAGPEEVPDKVRHWGLGARGGFPDQHHDT